MSIVKLPIHTLKRSPVENYNFKGKITKFFPRSATPPATFCGKAVDYLLAVIQGNMQVSAFGGVKATTVATQRERRKHCGRTPDCRNWKTHFGTGVQKAKKSNLHIFVCVSVSVTWIEGESETKQKCALHRQVCQNTKTSSSSLMCVCVCVCLWVWEKAKGGSASCWGLGHA